MSYLHSAVAFPFIVLLMFPLNELHYLDLKVDAADRIVTVESRSD
jgi:hypothetical protein